jgi:formylglycine-generating enzyme required for sulfatase activity
MGRTLWTSQGDAFDIEPHPLGSGGEAHVHAMNVETTDGIPLVAKLYHAVDPVREAKLRAMLASPPLDPMRSRSRVSIAWPLELAMDRPDGGMCVGFIMPRVSQVRPAFVVMNPKDRREQCSGFTWQYLLTAARNLAAAMKGVHAKGYVVGDVNESNLLVADDAIITLVDCDSFQVPGDGGVLFRCPVGKPEFTSPELQRELAQGARFVDLDRQEVHDRFGLGVLVFQFLMEGTHPFHGRLEGDNDPPPVDERILRGWFPYGGKAGPLRPKPVAPPFALLPPEVGELFRTCFEVGHARPEDRPAAATWVEVLDRAMKRTRTCPVQPLHVFGAHLAECPWCQRARLLGGRDPFAGSAPAAPPPAARPRPASAPPSVAPASVTPTPAPARARGRGLWRWAAGLLIAVATVSALAVYRRGQPARGLAAREQAQGNTPTLGQAWLVPGLGLDLAPLAAGSFQMGSANDGNNKKPVHGVTLSKPFWMGRTEVTQAEYEAMVGTNPSNFKGARLPVESVSWNDAVGFCTKLTERERAAGRLPAGYGYRLPTEAEWEYACRAGTTGDAAGELDVMAWYDKNSGSKTHEVGTKQANAWGLYDMHGNVQEWCQDYYASYSAGDATDPVCAAGSSRVARGGSWNGWPCESSFRFDSYDRFPGNRYDHLGFRVVLAPVQQAGAR